MEEQPATHEFTLERSGGHAMKIVEVIPNAPYLRAEATPLSGEGRYKITVTATTDTGQAQRPIVNLPAGTQPRARAIIDPITVSRNDR